MKLFPLKLSRQSNQIKYSAAILAFALTACGEDVTKPSLSNRSVKVSASESPKVLMTCTLKQDSDDKYYVYKTSKDQYYIADANDPGKPLEFKFFDTFYSYFAMAKGDFGRDTEVATVKQKNNDQLGWLAMVVNSDDRTLEVVRYSNHTNRISTGAIPAAELQQNTQVLLSSKSCEVGRTRSRSEARQADRKARLEAGAEKAVEKTAKAADKGVESVEQDAKDNEVNAQKNEQQAETALDQAKQGVKEAVTAIGDLAKEAGSDIKEEVSQWVYDPKPSRSAIEALRELISQTK